MTGEMPDEYLLILCSCVYNRFIIVPYIPFSPLLFKLKANMTPKQRKANNTKNAKKVARCRANKKLRQAAAAAGSLVSQPEEQQVASKVAHSSPAPRPMRKDKENMVLIFCSLKYYHCVLNLNGKGDATV